jgi:hypothetical protein
MASSCTAATCSIFHGLHQYLYGGGLYQKRVSKYKSVHVELIDLCTDTARSPRRRMKSNPAIRPVKGDLVVANWTSYIDIIYLAFR